MAITHKILHNVVPGSPSSLTSYHPTFIFSLLATVMFLQFREIARFLLQSLVCVRLVTQECPTLCDPLDCSPPGTFVHGDSLGKNTGVDCHALLQGIFPTQRSNPGLPHCRQILYHLSYQGSPIYLLSPPTETLCTTNFSSSG